MDDSDDEKEPAEFVYTDSSSLLLLPAVKHAKKTLKNSDEDPQETSPGLIHKEPAKPVKKIPATSCTHILKSGARQCRLKASNETGKFCKYYKKTDQK